MKLINRKKNALCYKGDQNIFWDGFLSDIALKEHWNIPGPDLRFQFFIHDEKLGTPDLNWAYYAGNPTNSFMLSDDYADAHGDACYINLDLSEGLFYLPVNDPKQLENAGIPLRSLARQFVKHKDKLSDLFFHKASSMGLDLDTSMPRNNQWKDCTKRCMDEYFHYHPEQKIFYLFTKAQARKGIVPIRDQNQLFSSIPIHEANLLSKLINLYHQYGILPLISQSNSKAHSTKIKERSSQLVNYLSSTLSAQSTLLDLEKASAQYFIHQLGFNEKDMVLQCSSDMHVSPGQYGIRHNFFQLALNKTAVFAETYNQSLDNEKKHIQRIKPIQNYLPLPFYFLKDELQGRFRYPVYQMTDSSDLVYKTPDGFIPFRPSKDYSRIIGKAMPLLNELGTYPHMMAMPEEGSKYASACKSWIQLLRQQGIANEPVQIIRIELNALDHLFLADECIIRLPSFLQQVFGSQISNKELANSWRTVVRESQNLLKLFGQFLPGQEVLCAIQWKENRFSFELTQKLNTFMGSDGNKLLEELLQEYRELSAERKNAKDQWSSDKVERFEVLKYEITLWLNFFKKNLFQWEHGLNYLNHRPYFLPFFLFFGEKYIKRWIKKVTFRIETW